MAIFTTTNSSFHGHPEPLLCPEGVSRKSIALYYYSACEAGGQCEDGHSTLFLDKDGNATELTVSMPVLRRIKHKLFG
jgi:hypothetical protein